MKVLLSIKPQYAELILSGKKRFEFRRQIYKNPAVSTVVIYVTKPVGKVVGEFTIREIHHGTPKDLWTLTKAASGIDPNSYKAYFEGKSMAFAIEVDKVTKYKRPMNLKDLLPSGCPPQSFAYLPV